MTDGLDINTPRGQATLADVARAVALVERRWPGCKYFRTPEDERAKIDGMIVRGDTMAGIVACACAAVVELKCRYDMSVEMFETVRGSEWLITHAKLKSGRATAELFRVPYWGFLFFPSDGVLMIQKIYCPKDGWIARHRVARTRTQATINGGSAVRANAFIDMSNAIRISE